MMNPVSKTPTTTHVTPRTPASAIHKRDLTKKQQLVRILSGKTGASIASASAKFGWQAHTTRAALSGLRKAGFNITAEKSAEGKPTCYRISGQTAQKDV